MMVIAARRGLASWMCRSANGERQSAMPLNLPLILHTVLEDYTLPWNGFHGVAHWARVLENGLRLAEEIGCRHRGGPALCRAARLPAVQRAPRPGARPARCGARAVASGRRISSSPISTSGCCIAPALGHTHERTHPDVTIQTCWDADRLDLGRVGMMPDPRYLSTEIARRQETIWWADGRATSWFHSGDREK